MKFIKKPEIKRIFLMPKIKIFVGGVYLGKPGF